MQSFCSSWNICFLKCHIKRAFNTICDHKNVGLHLQMDRVKRIWYLSHMRAAKVQASLRIRAVSPEPSLLAHTSSESRGTFRQKARSLASLNGWACAVKICHDGMLEDTNSLDGAQMSYVMRLWFFSILCKLIFQTCVRSHPVGLYVWFLDPSSTSILHVCKQRRLWQDYVDAIIPESHGQAQMTIFNTVISILVNLFTSLSFKLLP